MSSKLSIALLNLSALAASAPALSGVPVRLSGRTAADSELQRDILQNIVVFGSAFNCAAPSQVRISVVDPASIPQGADYLAPSRRATYEEWDAEFCGKTHRFFVSFWPDPAGGSFLAVQYPYPAGAPAGVTW